MPKPHPRLNSSKYWYLYWVESDGLEDCFVAARNARSACSLEIQMNGFDRRDVRAAKLARITPNIERSYRREYPDHQWPGYVYGKTLFEKIGAQFRTVDDRQEMLLDDVVYEIDGEYEPSGIRRIRTIGRKAVLELRSDPLLGSLEHHDEDIWDGPAIHLITGLGMFDNMPAN